MLNKIKENIIKKRSGPRIDTWGTPMKQLYICKTVGKYFKLGVRKFIAIGIEICIICYAE